jgi:CRP/FNR family transcriptional regulator, nitrogen oxide reductase regulator
MATELTSALLELGRLQPKSFFLRPLSPDNLQQLAENASFKSYPARASVFQTGEPAKQVYLILSGVWKLFQSADNGRVANLAFVSAGEVICIHSALGFATCQFSADVVVPSRVLVWPAAILRKLTEDTPDVALNLCEILTRRFFEFSARYRELMTENVEQRIAHALIRLGEQIGKPQGSGLIIDTPVSLEDLAGYAGTTLFTMSRILNRWQRDGLVQRKHGVVILHDLESIEKVANRVHVRKRA